jgi:hypothetical protein
MQIVPLFYALGRILMLSPIASPRQHLPAAAHAWIVRQASYMIIPEEKSLV